MKACKDECKVGNFNGLSQCTSKSYESELKCSRNKGHEGDHVACGVECGLDVWSIEVLVGYCPVCESPLEDNGACSDVGSNSCQFQL